MVLFHQSVTALTFNMKKIFIILLLFVLASCEEVVEWPIENYVTPRLVVEGMLTNRQGFNYVTLTLPVTDPNLEPQPLSGATVAITDGENITVLTESLEKPGTYIPGPEVTGVVYKSYGLYISISQYAFTAYAYMIPVTPLKEFTYYQLEKHPGYYVISPDKSGQPSYTEYKVEWINSSEPSTIHTSLFYTFTISTIDVNQFFKPASEYLVFPGNARIIRTKYSLSPGHEKFIRGLLSETEWNGGWFDLLPGNLHTNLSTGAVGYFAACSVVRDTVYFE